MGIVCLPSWNVHDGDCLIRQARKGHLQSRHNGRKHQLGVWVDAGLGQRVHYNWNNSDVHLNHHTEIQFLFYYCVSIFLLLHFLCSSFSYDFFYFFFLFHRHLLLRCRHRHRLPFFSFSFPSIDFPLFFYAISSILHSFLYLYYSSCFLHCWSSRIYHWNSLLNHRFNFTYPYPCGIFL